MSTNKDSKTFQRDNTNVDESKSKGQALGNHTETAGDVASALYAGDDKRPEAKGAIDKIADATDLKASRTSTTDPFPAHEGKGPEHRGAPGVHAGRAGRYAGGGRDSEGLLRHARKVLLANGAANANAQLLADINEHLGDVDDGAPAPAPRMSDAALKGLEAQAHIDPTFAARLAIERNNIKAQGGTPPDLEPVDPKSADKTGADVNPAADAR